MALQYWRLQLHKLWQILPRQKGFQTPLGWCGFNDQNGWCWWQEPALVDPDQTHLGWCKDYYGMWFCCNATIHPAGISLFCLRLTSCQWQHARYQISRSVGEKMPRYDILELWWSEWSMLMTRTSSGRPWPMPAKAENMSGAPFPRAMIVTPAMFWDNLATKLLPVNSILSKIPEGLWDDFDGGTEIVVCSNSQADEKHHKPDDIQNHLGQWRINWVYHFWSPSYDISRKTVMW